MPNGIQSLLILCTYLFVRMFPNKFIFPLFLLFSSSLHSFWLRCCVIVPLHQHTDEARYENRTQSPRTFRISHGIYLRATCTWYTLPIHIHGVNSVSSEWQTFLFSENYLSVWCNVLRSTNRQTHERTSERRQTQTQRKTQKLFNICSVVVIGNCWYVLVVPLHMCLHRKRNFHLNLYNDCVLCWQRTQIKFIHNLQWANVIPLLYYAHKLHVSNVEYCVLCATVCIQLLKLILLSWWKVKN